MCIYRSQSETQAEMLTYAVQFILKTLGQTQIHILLPWRRGTPAGSRRATSGAAAHEEQADWCSAESPALLFQIAHSGEVSKQLNSILWHVTPKAFSVEPTYDSCKGKQVSWRHHRPFRGLSGILSLQRAVRTPVSRRGKCACGWFEGSGYT